MAPYAGQDKIATRGVHDLGITCTAITSSFIRMTNRAFRFMQCMPRARLTCDSFFRPLAEHSWLLGLASSDEQPITTDPCQSSMADQNDVDLDSIIDRLLEVRGSRPGKQVQLLETEIRYLCTKAREIFISQPILLELEAPIKVSFV